MIQVKYEIPSQQALMEKRTQRAAITMARHHQLLRDIRKNRQAELDRINMGMKNAAFLLRRRKFLVEAIKESLPK